MVVDDFGRTIRTASEVPGLMPQNGGYRKWVEELVRMRYAAGRVNWDVRGEVLAEVSNAHWRVDCPFCRGAQLIEPGFPFFCVDCLMAGNQGYAMLVVWPENRADIESVLLARPGAENMNWLASKGEKLEDIIQENLDHGCKKSIGAL